MALGNNSSSALTHTLTLKKPAPITAPLPAVPEATPQELMGTVVDTAHGLAVQVGEELIPVDEGANQQLEGGEYVEWTDKAPLRNTPPPVEVNSNMDMRRLGSSSDKEELWNESGHCLTHPRQCGVTRHAYEAAFRDSVKYFPDSEGYDGADDRRDAARHCIYVGIQAADADIEYAKHMAHVHEIKSDGGYGTPAGVMDTHNNQTALEVGKRHPNDAAAVIHECVILANNAQKVPVGTCPSKSGTGLIYYRDPGEPSLAEQGTANLDMSSCPVGGQEHGNY